MVNEDEKQDLILQIKILAQKNKTQTEETIIKLNNLNSIKTELINLRKELIDQSAFSIKLGLNLKALYAYKCKLDLFYVDLGEIILSYLKKRDEEIIKQVNYVKQSLEINNFNELISISTQMQVISNNMQSNSGNFTKHLESIKFSEDTNRICAFSFPQNHQYMVSNGLNGGVRGVQFCQWKNLILHTLLRPLDNSWKDMCLDNFQDVETQLTDFDSNYSHFNLSLQKEIPGDLDDIINTNCNFEQFVNSSFLLN